MHRLGGRLGRGRVIDHLLGKTKDVAPSESAMSTYGIGREFSAAGWRDLLDQLLFEGLLREDPNDGRPLVGVGDAEAVRAVSIISRVTASRSAAPAPGPPARTSRMVRMPGMIESRAAKRKIPAA